MSLFLISLAVQQLPATPPAAPPASAAPAPVYRMILAPPPEAPPVPDDIKITRRPDAGRYYPNDLRKRGVEGTTTIGVTVGYDGKASDCAVLEGSGNADLDAAACRLGRDLRFDEAKDAYAPLPIRVQWRSGGAQIERGKAPLLPRLKASDTPLITPEDYPAEAIRNGLQGTTQLLLTVSAEGVPTDCAIVSTSGSSTLDQTACRLLMLRARYEPGRGPFGKVKEMELRQRIRWTLPSLPQAPRSTAVPPPFPSPSPLPAPPPPR